MATVKEIVIKYLKSNKYDGLYNIIGDCGCEISSFAPCGEMLEGCKAGYKVESNGDCSESYDFCIRDKKINCNDCECREGNS